MKMLENPEQRKIDQLTEEEVSKSVMRLHLGDIETLCIRNGIKTLKLKRTDKTATEKYAEYLKNKLSISEVFEYAKEQKIDLEDISAEYQRKIDNIRENFEEDYYPATGNSEFEKFLRTISMKFSPVQCMEDSDLQMQMAQFIKLEFPEKYIEVNFESSKGRISLLVDHEYGLLPVIASSREKLRNTIGEIEDYLKVCRDASIIALDNSSIPSLEIEEYVKEVVNMGAYFTVINQYVMQKKIEVI